jgi:hypothetical protein
MSCPCPQPHDTPEQCNAWLRGQLAERDEIISSLRIDAVERNAQLQASEAGRGTVLSLLSKLYWFNSAPNSDWACAECIPHSDMLKSGFLCAYHAAGALIVTPAPDTAALIQRAERERAVVEAAKAYDDAPMTLGYLQRTALYENLHAKLVALAALDSGPEGR